VVYYLQTKKRNLKEWRLNMSEDLILILLIFAVPVFIILSILYPEMSLITTILVSLFAGVIIPIWGVVLAYIKQL